MSADRLPYDPSIDPCPQCGAWTWQTIGRLEILDGGAVDMLRCGECAHEIARQDARAVLVGLD